MNIENQDSNEILLTYKNENLSEKESSDAERCALPLMPVDGFPAELQEIINTCSVTYGTPRDYWAGAALIASALGIGNKLQLVTNYRNLPVLWIVLVGDVSSGKSYPVDFCLNYFKRLDSRSIMKYKQELEEFEKVSRLAPKERQAMGITGQPEKPKCFQYILNDFTPEAMVEAHTVNNRGLLIERDELKGWIDDFGRYNKSGEQSNMLTSWSGIGISYNRKTSGIMNIAHPCIMVCGGMQPALLPALGADYRIENGFLSRLCTVYPDNTSKAAFNENKLPENILFNWEKYLSRLIKIEPQQELRLSSEAKEKYSEWYNLNAQLTNEDTSGYVKGVYGKLDIISLRLAIVIRGMNLACDGTVAEEISGEEMVTAIGLTEYFRATALKVYKTLFGPVDIAGLNKRNVANYLYHKLENRKVDIKTVLKTSGSQLERLVG